MAEDEREEHVHRAHRIVRRKACALEQLEHRFDLSERRRRDRCARREDRHLPGASIERALLDVRAAIDCGFDQICCYNLVLNRELDTEWANDASLVGAMPGADRACATWLAVRATLLEQGFVQTTLTNFERAEVARTERRFVYERASFDPATRDAIGFGPGGISTVTARDRRRAIKWMNSRTGPATIFDYSSLDLRILHLTRNLAKLEIDAAQYREFFGTDIQRDFAAELEVLEDARLLVRTGELFAPTPEGMFFADSIAGVFAADGAMATSHAMG